MEITNSFIHRELSYKLVVVGGGAGGCGTANKFANKLGKDQVFGGNLINLLQSYVIMAETSTNVRLQ